MVDGRIRQILEPLCPGTERKFSELALKERDHLVVWLSQDGRKLLAEAKALEPLKDASRLEEKSCDGRQFERWGFPSWESREFWTRVPECKWLGGHKNCPAELREVHELAATDFTALLIKCLWPEDRVIYRSEHAKVLVDYLYLRFQRQATFGDQLARYKVLGQQPALPTAFAKYWRDHDDENLRLADYQRAVCVSSLGMEAVAYFMEQGTGKTLPSIQRVCVEGSRKRTETGKMYWALVVCPPQVRLNWQNEFRRFATRPGKVVVVRGNQRKRIGLLTEAISNEADCEYGVAVISYDSLIESLDGFCRVPWDLVIFDESHKFKSHSTKRFLGVRQVRDVAKQRQILTGSPIGNSIMDLYAQLEVLGEGLSGFSSWQDFRLFHGVWEATDGEARGVERLTGVRNVPLLQERLARLSFVITKEEAGLKLPDKVATCIEVEMTPAQSDAYKKIGEELAIEIEDAMSGDVDQMVIENILTKLLRLAQVTSGFVSFPEVKSEDGEKTIKPKRVIPIPGPNPKIEALVEFLTDEQRDPKAKSIVWACWREDIKRICERLKAEGIEHASYFGDTPQSQRDEIVWRFNHDPKLKVLVCNAQTAGEGLNLVGYCVEGDKCQRKDFHPQATETYCDAAIFFSQTWSAIARSQAEDRAHRRGTKMPVQMIDLTVPGSIDEEIRSRVVEKREMARTVTDVREVLSNVLSCIRSTVGSST